MISDETLDENIPVLNYGWGAIVNYASIFSILSRMHLRYRNGAP